MEQQPPSGQSPHTVSLCPAPQVPSVVTAPVADDVAAAVAVTAEMTGSLLLMAAFWEVDEDGGFWDDTIELAERLVDDGFVLHPL